MLIVLSGLVLLSAIMMIKADYTDNHRQVFIFKPLTMAFVLIIALQEDVSVSDTYKWLIIAGLVFSMMGDAWLMLPQDKFIQGLASFLVAHIFYIIAFTRPANHLPAVLWLVPLVLFGLGIFAYLRPSLGHYLPPVAVYMTVILLMGWVSINRYEFNSDWGGVAAVAGAALFMASDTILAINRFRQPFKAAQLLILATYFAAQWLIAQSI